MSPDGAPSAGAVGSELIGSVGQGRKPFSKLCAIDRCTLPEFGIGARQRDDPFVRRDRRASAKRLAGANGHDSVGGLMPLPLWPSLRTPVTAKSGKRSVRNSRLWAF
jgi:hypothetical protein